VSEGQRAVLETLSRSSSAPHREVLRARALLLAADGVANDRIAAEVGVSATSVRSWQRRFTDDGLTRFGRVRPGRGAKPSIPPEMVEAIVQATLHATPAGQTQWSCRTMAAGFGVSAATVQRIWHARGLKPHLVETFKLSNDPAFEEKLTDVVGLYLDPPEQAVVLCMDEKSQVQALDRTQPSLPMKKGRAGTMTHDYHRHGTTTLFAALNVLTGLVIGQCLPRHRHEEFAKFLRTVDRQVPTGLAVHLIMRSSGVARRGVGRHGGTRATAKIDCPNGALRLDSNARVRGMTCPSQMRSSPPSPGVIRNSRIPKNQVSSPGMFT